MAGQDGAFCLIPHPYRCQDGKNSRTAGLHEGGITLLPSFQDLCQPSMVNILKYIFHPPAGHLFPVLPQDILHHRIHGRNHAVLVHVDHAVKGIIQQRFNLGIAPLFRSHGKVHVLRHGKCGAQGILCHGQEQGRASGLLCSSHRHIPSNHQVGALLNGQPGLFLKSCAVGGKVGPQPDIIDSLKV